MALVAAGGGDAGAAEGDRVAALERENEALKSNLAGTEEACEGMQRELERIQKEYNDLAQTLSGTLDTTGEEEEEEY
jgi:predicted RNase H-like nuclease (RuvC/YqgF family)